MKKIKIYELAKESKENCQWLGNGEFTYDSILGCTGFCPEETKFMTADKKLKKAVLTVLYIGLIHYTDEFGYHVYYNLPPTGEVMNCLKFNWHSCQWYMKKIKNICMP